MKHTINDLVDFVIKNRRNKAWVDWSPIEIADAIVQSLQDNALVYCVNEMGSIVGLITGIKFASQRTMYVTNVLTIERSALRQFVTWFSTVYPGWHLEARRHDKEVRYGKGTSRLLRGLLNINKD